MSNRKFPEPPPEAPADPPKFRNLLTTSTIFNDFHFHKPNRLLLIEIEFYTQ